MYFSIIPKKFIWLDFQKDGGRRGYDCALTLWTELGMDGVGKIRNFSFSISRGQSRGTSEP